MHTLTHPAINTAAGLWNRGSNWPAAMRARNVVNESELESEPKTNGRLGAVRGATRVASPAMLYVGEL